jgi:hypothetical protein
VFPSQPTALNNDPQRSCGDDWFLLLQVVPGLLMSLGMLLGATNSGWYQALYAIHADWNPWGAAYRVILGVATVVQAILGITIYFLSRSRFK